MIIQYAISFLQLIFGLSIIAGIFFITYIIFEWLHENNYLVKAFCIFVVLMLLIWLTNEVHESRIKDCYERPEITWCEELEIPKPQKKVHYHPISVDESLDNDTGYDEWYERGEFVQFHDTPLTKFLGNLFI